MFPQNDEQFQDNVINKVSAGESGWSVGLDSGWSFWIPPESPVVPQAGMSIRLYGKGIGFAVRGLFLDGQQVFYRTEEGDKEHREIEAYGKDAADWLQRWDDGKTVWSISMGGIGPGYEQAIQIATAELLRHILENQYDSAAWSIGEHWKIDREKIEAASFKMPRIEALGLSGAQFGAALHLAAQLYTRGPRAIMNDERVQDRHIMVQRTFPVPA